MGTVDRHSSLAASMRRMAWAIVAAAAVGVASAAPGSAAEKSSTSAGTLAEAAEAFAENVLGLPQGSVRAQSIDRRLPLGDCASGWAWGFAFGSRQTVQVVCPGDPKSRRFIALAFPAEPAPASKTDDAAVATTVVPIRDLPYGHILSAMDLREEPLKSGSRPSSMGFSSIDVAIGQMLTRPVRAGESLGRADLRSAVLIRRNAMVVGWSEFAGGRVSAKLVALEAGKLGEWIALENPQSGRKLRGEVQRDGSVRLGTRGVTSTVTASTAKVPPVAVD